MLKTSVNSVCVKMRAIRVKIAKSYAYSRCTCDYNSGNCSHRKTRKLSKKSKS